MVNNEKKEFKNSRILLRRVSTTKEVARKTRNVDICLFKIKFNRQKSKNLYRENYTIDQNISLSLRQKLGLSEKSFRTRANKSRFFRWLKKCGRLVPDERKRSNQRWVSSAGGMGSRKWVIHGGKKTNAQLTTKRRNQPCTNTYMEEKRRNSLWKI